MSHSSYCYIPYLWTFNSYFLFLLVLYTLPMNINGYVPFLILLYTLPMNINGYVPFLILLYTLPMNINGYVPFLILLYTLPMNINGYVPFLILLYTLPMNINVYFSFHINMLETIVRVWKYHNCFGSGVLLGQSYLTYVLEKPTPGHMADSPEPQEAVPSGSNPSCWG